MQDGITDSGICTAAAGVQTSAVGDEMETITAISGLPLLLHTRGMIEWQAVVDIFKGWMD